MARGDLREQIVWQYNSSDRVAREAYSSEEFEEMGYVL